MNNISTYNFGKKLFIYIDLSNIQGKNTIREKPKRSYLNGYRPLEIDRRLRLKLHLYELGNESQYGDFQERDTEPADLNQLLAIASGLNNQQRQDLVKGISQMMVRDSTD